MERTRSNHRFGNRFQHLLDNVYGPYPDHIFLEKELVPKPSPDGCLDIHCMTLYAGKLPIGLDKTEYIITPPQDSFVHEEHPNHETVSFCGTVEIRDLAWLAKQGRSYLERDVRDHDKASFPHVTGNRDISLDQVLNGAQRGQGFKIYLMCQKRHLAHYMTHRRRQSELLIYSISADGLVKRQFSVKSLHAQTYLESKTFLARYRLRALLAELNEIDDHGTPVNLKDHHWVVQNYVAHILPRDADLERRQKLRGAPQSSLDADNTLYPKHLRHIPQSELYSELAEHADWILANQIAQTASKPGVSKGLVFIPSWVEWCKEAFVASNEARRAGVNWGMSESVHVKNSKRNNVSLSERLARFGQSQEFWEARLKSWMKSSKEYVETLSKEPPQPSKGRKQQPIPFKSGGYQPDPAFSPGYTSSEWPDSDGVDIAYQNRPLKGVSFCSQPPQIPFGHFVWCCPGQYCYKEIDLLNILPQDLLLIPPDLASIFKTKQWKVQDTLIQHALAIMVSHHYQHEHLALAGVHLLDTKNKLQVQPSKTIQRSHPRHRRAHILEVKEEDSS